MKNKISKLEKFADRVGIGLEANRSSGTISNQWRIWLKNTQVLGRISKTFGIGKTLGEAIRDYERKIHGTRLVVDSQTKQRREIACYVLEELVEDDGDGCTDSCPENKPCCGDGGCQEPCEEHSSKEEEIFCSECGKSLSKSIEDKNFFNTSELTRDGGVQYSCSYKCYELWQKRTTDGMFPDCVWDPNDGCPCQHAEDCVKDHFKKQPKRLLKDESNEIICDPDNCDILKEVRKTLWKKVNKLKKELKDQTMPCVDKNNIEHCYCMSIGRSCYDGDCIGCCEERPEAADKKLLEENKKDQKNPCRDKNHETCIEVDRECSGEVDCQESSKEHPDNNTKIQQEEKYVTNMCHPQTINLYQICKKLEEQGEQFAYITIENSKHDLVWISKKQKDNTPVSFFGESKFLHDCYELTFREWDPKEESIKIEEGIKLSSCSHTMILNSSSRQQNIKNFRDVIKAIKSYLPTLKVELTTWS